MTAPGAHVAVYKAVADFSDVIKEAAKAREAMRLLDRDVKAHSRSMAQSMADQGKSWEKVSALSQQLAQDMGTVEKAQEATRATTERLRDAQGRFISSTQEAENQTRRLRREQEDLTRATDSTASSTERLRDSQGRFVRTTDDAQRGLRAIARDMVQAWRSADQGTSALTRLGRAIRTALSSGGAGGGGDDILRRLGQGVDSFGSKVVGLLSRLAGFPGFLLLLASGAGALVASLGTLGGATLAAAGGLASLGGAAAALPGLFFAAASAVGALITAVGPLGGVFKAYSQQQAAGGGGGGSGAADQARQAADRVRQATRQVELAERGVADAQYEARRAQEGLTDARRDASRGLEDLRRQVGRYSLDEEGAQLAVQRARQSLKETERDRRSSALDRAEAALSLKEAEYDLQSVLIQGARDRDDLSRAEVKGVENSDQVVDANRSVHQSQLRVADSEYELIEAHRALAVAQEKQAAGAAGGGGAVDKFKEALDKLSPSARAFVLGIIAMGAAWKEVRLNVQERFFAPVVGQLDNMRKFLPTLNSLLGESSAALGDLTARAIEMVTTSWVPDLEVMAGENAILITNMGDALLFVADGFRHLMMAAAPFTRWVTEALERGAKAFATWAENGRQSGEIASGLDKVKERLQVMGRILGNLVQMFGSWISASSDFTDWFLGKIEAMTARWRDNAAEQEKSGSGLKKWLEDIKPLLTEISHLVGKITDTFKDMASDPENIKQATDLVKELNRTVDTFKRIFDAMRDTGLLDTVVQSFNDIAEAFAGFLEAGGGESIKTFIETLSSILTFLLGIGSQEGVAGTLGVIGGAMGVFLAFMAVGKLTGMFAVFDFLRWLVRNKSSLTSLKGIMDMAVNGGAPIRGRDGRLRDSKGRFISEDDAPGGGTTVVGTGGGRDSGGRHRAPTSGRRVGRAGILGAAAGLLAIPAISSLGGDDEPSQSASSSGRPDWRTSLSNLGSSTGSGAAAGAAIGSVVPVVGTGVGAAAGAAVGAQVGALTDPGIRGGLIPNFDQAWTEWNKFADTMAGFYSGLLPDKVKDFGSQVVGWLFPDNDIDDALGEISSFFMEDFPDAVKEGGQEVLDFFLEDLPNAVDSFSRDIPHKIGFAIGYVAGSFYQLFSETIPNFLTETVPNWFSGVFGFFDTQVSQPINTFLTETLPNFFTDTIPSWFSSVPDNWETQVASTIRNFIFSLPGLWASSAGSWFSAVGGFWFRNVFSPIFGFVLSLPSLWASSAASWFSTVWGVFYDKVVTPVGNYIKSIPSKVADAAKDVVSGVAEGFGMGRKHSGGLITGPGREVAQILEPGEYVVRKEVVGKPGVQDFLRDLNSEVLAPSDLYGSLNLAVRDVITPPAVTTARSPAPVLDARASDDRMEPSWAVFVEIDGQQLQGRITQTIKDRDRDVKRRVVARRGS
jgi:uncharacterized coiled-coil protein SlyX